MLFAACHPHNNQSTLERQDRLKATMSERNNWLKVVPVLIQTLDYCFRTEWKNCELSFNYIF